MTQTEWHQRWDEGRIGFHENAVHPDLVAFENEFLAGKHRVLVPLSGKSVDISWLAKRGHHAVGVELVAKAVHEFHAESGIEPTITDEGAVQRFASPGIDILRADVFDVSREHVGAIDRIWDRAALVALPPDVRGRYVARLRELVDPGTLVLQNFFEYDSSLMEGPPFSVTQEEVRQHYVGAEIQVLDQRDVIDQVRWREQGHSYWLTTTLLIRL